MHPYDIVMLAVIVAATIFGAIKGFAWQLASIASIVLSYGVAYNLRDAVSQNIQMAAPWNSFLAMLILFVATSLMVWVGFQMARQIIDRLALKDFDHHVGAVFGAIKGGLYCTLLTLFTVTLAGETVRRSVATSRSGNAIAAGLAKTESVVPPEVHDYLTPYLARLENTPTTY